MPPKQKPKVGFYDLSGCNGCLLSVFFNEDEILDLVGHLDIAAFRLVIGKKAKDLDIAFVEGLVADAEDLEMLNEIRQNAKVLVALGTCAATGCIPAYRNWVSPAKYANMVYDRKKEHKDLQPLPIHKYVQVDFTVPGCPPDKKQIKEFVKDVLLGKKPQDYDRPVCFECKLHENRCLLEDNKLCLGPITKGGCDSICTNGGWECWGCRGHTPDANVDMMVKLLQEKGFKKAAVEKRIKSFVGVTVEEPPKQKMPKPLSLKRFQKEKPKPAKKAKVVKKTKQADKAAKGAKAKPKVVKTAKKMKKAKTVVKKKPAKGAKGGTAKTGVKKSKVKMKPKQKAAKTPKKTKVTKVKGGKAKAKPKPKPAKKMPVKKAAPAKNSPKPSVEKKQSLFSKLKKKLSK
ncbi:TPA: hypothetical protein HA265_06990 [Candidatus Woesearchaeota archaeon]|nr:hypothetical protein [Candidatus Woesearchaeota archaeon]